MIFADKLIQLRKKSGWSQEELAEQMGVSRQSISKWEGAQSIPDLEKIIRLAKLFSVSTDYLLTGDIVDKDLLLLSEKLHKLSPSQLRTVEAIIDECNALFQNV